METALSVLSGTALPGQPTQTCGCESPRSADTSPPALGETRTSPSSSISTVTGSRLLAMTSGPPTRLLYPAGVRLSAMANGNPPLGVIGNCSYLALVSAGSVEWLCWPRPDSSFVFGPLLDRERGGAFTIEGIGATDVEHSYLENTNVLRTVFTAPTGSFELIEFAPRFQQYDRAFKPSMLVRICRPLSGDPLVRIRCRPVYDYGRHVAPSWRASNHLEFAGLGAPLRLTTNVPLSYVEEERPFLLDRDCHLVLTYGEPLEAGLEGTAETFLERTVDYWREWVKRTRVPRDYQREVIRSALVLKLHSYEDTGALLAAATTSLPEHPGSGRTWDYRYCWLRDAYFTLNALERLGHAEEMELFLLFLRNLAEERGGELLPVYTISGGGEAEEIELTHLTGFHGNGPVRVGNQAFHHPQNDVYGEMILAVSRLMMDARFSGSIETPRAVELVEELLAQIDRRLDETGRRPVGAPRREEAPQLHRAHALGGRASRGGARSRPRRRAPRHVGRRSRRPGESTARGALLGRRRRGDHAGGRRPGARCGAAPHAAARVLRRRRSEGDLPGARDP